MKKCALLILTPLLLWGCGKDDEIKTYQVAPTPQETIQKTEAPQTMDLPFQATLPKGWVQKPASGIRVVSYKIEKSALDFYLVVLYSGELVPNVNLWRKQLHLPPLTPAKIQTLAKPVTIDGVKALSVTLYNEKLNAGIFSTIIKRGPKSFWFFTAKGLASDLKKELPEIQTFLQSVRFKPAP